jgi:ubiquinone/menaquinone biosynthesis C-methylase UbiE
VSNAGGESVAEQIWDSFSRINAGERFRAQSAEMGTAVTEAVVEAAAVAPGMSVLDVACGAGEPSISLAALLEGTGHVAGVDMAAAPLEVARGRASKRGLENVEFLQGDVHALPFADESFDRITSRLGVMFFDDLARALGEMRRVLRPGGRVALLAWGAMEQPYFEMTIGTALRLHPELEIPAGARVMFKFGVPGTLSAAVDAAGFFNIREELRKLRWDWHGTPEEMWDYFRGVTVPFRALLDKVEGDAEVDRAVLTQLRERFDGEYVRIEAQMVVVTAEKI